MALDLHAQLAKLLNRAPDFRAAGFELFCDTCPANHDGSVIAKQADNAAQARVSRILIGSGTPLCTELSDAEIMSERSEDSKVRRYAGCNRMLKSAAGTECVSAPTEMKSTPASA
jgi:hypothetical protein